MGLTSWRVRLSDGSKRIRSSECGSKVWYTVNRMGKVIWRVWNDFEVLPARLAYP